MVTVVNCVLPRNVEDYMQAKYNLPASSILLKAAKAYTQQPTSQTASLAVGRMAVENGCTKTDIYRLALIRFDPSLEDLWPKPKRTPAQVRGSRAYMVDYDPTPKRAQAPPAPSGKAKLITALRGLRDSLPTMSTRQIAARMDTIIRKLEQHSSEPDHGQRRSNPTQ